MQAQQVQQVGLLLIFSVLQPIPLDCDHGQSKPSGRPNFASSELWLRQLSEVSVHGHLSFILRYLPGYGRRWYHKARH